MTFAANKQQTLEAYFEQFRKHIVGIQQRYQTPYGDYRILYADWTASGRLYDTIEHKILESFGPFVGNTHTESNVTGTSMTQAYHLAQKIIKDHVHAGAEDVLLNVGYGMTAAINKLQRILGLKIPERYRKSMSIPKDRRPIVFVTHMEHHSNQTTWLETMADVVVIKQTGEGLVDLNDLKDLLQKYRHRKMKIGSFTACSNVTGVQPPYRAMAGLMHEHGGLCFVDFAASAPYVPIDMHPADPLEKLDAIIFSPHKFLGGPGASGILIFDSHLYQLKSPDQPGGGTVLWTNPWGRHKFKTDIQEREDGGTPGFLQAIRSSLAVALKEEMGTEQMARREGELVRKMFDGLQGIPGLHILADNVRERFGIISFYFDAVHYNLVVRLLNDRFGIQMRGGCSCAGTYGHYLLHVDKYTSKRITDKIDHGDLSIKPGWVRMSIHPTTTDAEVEEIVSALTQIGAQWSIWAEDYKYDSQSNEFFHKNDGNRLQHIVEQWFRFS